MKYYNCVDITQMPEKVFSRADEFAHVTRVVMALLGIGGQLSEEEQKQADEKEIEMCIRDRLEKKLQSWLDEYFKDFL